MMKGRKAEMQNFNAVLFDMDGLLLDSEKLALAAFESTCARFELGDLSHVFTRLVGTNTALGKTLLREGLAGIMDAEVFAAQWQTQYRALTEDTPIPLMPGVAAFLKHTTALNIPMAVVTSSTSAQAKHKLTQAGILDYFRLIVGGDQVMQSKPAPEIYLLAAARMAVEPATCLALEDSANGVKAAVAAGMTVVQIPDLVPPDDELLALGHTVLDNIMAVTNNEFICA